MKSVRCFDGVMTPLSVLSFVEEHLDAFENVRKRRIFAAPCHDRYHVFSTFATA